MLMDIRVLVILSFIHIGATALAPIPQQVCGLLNCVSAASPCLFQEDLVVQCPPTTKVFDPFQQICFVSTATDLVIQTKVNITVVGECQVVFAVGGTFTLKQQAMISGATIDITASSFIMEHDAKLITSGKGRLNGLGAGSSRKGASYGGSGGQVQPPPSQHKWIVHNNKSIGSADLQEEWDNLVQNRSFTFGSGGGKNSRVRAGGRVRISASTSLTMLLNSHIEANGMAANAAGAGSGGSVLLITSALSLNGEITANGGDAVCNGNKTSCFPAGGGGRIMFSYTSSNMNNANTTASGGIAPADSPDADCLVGAAGTIYVVSRSASNSIELASVYIRNTGHSFSGRSLTVFEIPTGRVGTTMGLTLFVENYASCGSTSLSLGQGDMYVRKASRLISLQTSNEQGSLQIVCKDFKLHDRSEVFGGDGLILSAQSIEADASTQLLYSGHAVLMADNVVDIACNVSDALVSTPSPTVSSNTSVSILNGFVVFGDEIKSGGHVSTQAAMLYSSKTLVVTGSITTTRKSCDVQTWATCDQFQNDFEIFRELIIKEKRIVLQHSSYAVVLRSGGPVYVGQPSLTSSIVAASSTMICSNAATILAAGSVINGSGRGCLAEQGPGKGFCYAGDRLIGGGGGFGGAGGGAQGSGSGGYVYGGINGPAATGSGGGCGSGGSGGGIVRIETTALSLNGSIAVDGLSGGNGGGGGGSGGYVDLIVSNLIDGYGAVSANGGNGFAYVNQTMDPSDIKVSKDGKKIFGAGGGGGRIHLLLCDEHLFQNCANSLHGNYSVSGGASLSSNSALQGSPGTTSGKVCPPGYTGLFCVACSQGTYKTTFGSDACKKCTNAPEEAHYIESGSTSSSCDWVCNPGYSGMKCQTPFHQVLDLSGGPVGFGLLILGCFLFFSLVGFLCRRRHFGYHDRHHRLYKSATSKQERQKLLGPPSRRYPQTERWSFWTSISSFWRISPVSYPKLKEKDLPYHLYRLYLSGMNSPESPWHLNPSAPSKISSILFPDEFQVLANEINKAMLWPEGGIFSSWENFFMALSRLFCLPMTSDLVQRGRYKRLNTLKQILSKSNHAFLKGSRARALLNGVKVGFSGDYTLAYIELLYKENSELAPIVPDVPIGKPRLPIALLLSGAGTYEYPYYLDPHDLLVRSIPQCSELTSFIDDEWIELVAELNARLRQVHKDALAFTLYPVLTFLEQKNLTASLLGGLQIQLGRFWLTDKPRSHQPFKLGIYLSEISDALPTTINRSIHSEEPKSEYAHQPEFANTSISDQYSTFYPEEADPELENQGSTIYFSIDPQAIPAEMKSVSPGKGVGLGRRASLQRGIREEALHLRTRTSSSEGSEESYQGCHESVFFSTTRDAVGTIQVDPKLTLPGQLISSYDLQILRSKMTLKNHMQWFFTRYCVPCNVRKSGCVSSVWGPIFALLVLLLLDLALMFAMLANLRCIRDGETDEECSVGILLAVLLIYPFANILSPIFGIISLAVSTSPVVRKYALWNSLSMLNAIVCILVCVINSSRLAAPWFTRPVPLIPALSLVLKLAQASVIECYVADLETTRRRRGWRGLISRRDSESGSPIADTSYTSPIGQRRAFTTIFPQDSQYESPDTREQYGSI